MVPIHVSVLKFNWRGRVNPSLSLACPRTFPRPSISLPLTTQQRDNKDAPVSVPPLMAFAASAITQSLFTRLLRPFSTSSPSLSLAPESLASRNMPDNAQKATLAAGCFWGVEHLFRKHFGEGKGLLDAKVGYSGGQTQSPTYRSVCSGTTGRTSNKLSLLALQMN